MEQKKKETAGRYFAELSKCLHRQGFAVEPVTDGLLTANWQDAVLCHFEGDGGIRYPSTADPKRKAAVDRAYGIARMTAEYMKLMDQAPPLKADGLEGDYRLLSEFNDTVLAGHPTKYGVQFITWDWTYGHTGLCRGHYHMEDYDDSKVDFATRSGLVVKDQIFSPQQLT